MRIGKIEATNMELTPAIREYVEEKMEYIGNLLPDDDSLIADIEVGKTTHHHNKGKIMRCEVNLQVPGELLRVEKIEKNLYKAIDKVKDHLARQVKTYKNKKLGRRRWGRFGKN